MKSEGRHGLQIFTEGRNVGGDADILQKGPSTEHRRGGLPIAGQAGGGSCGARSLSMSPGELSSVFEGQRSRQGFYRAWLVGETLTEE